jgi:sporulation protein YlmC with PRC-barrel domain
MRLVVVGFFWVVAAACDKGGPPPAAPAAPAGTPAPSVATPARPAAPGALKGKVLETMGAATYTYLRLQTDQGETWAAVPQAAVAVGADVEVQNPMVMDGFESKTLNRRFDRIVFGSLGTPSQPAGHPVPAQVMPPAAAPITVAKAPGPGARTVAELYALKAELKGKPIQVRGQVVKVTQSVMGKNWLHLADGTGSPANKDHDITVTTSQVAAVGDVVLVNGVLNTDRDFGAGYAYPVIVEDATVQVTGK